MYIFKKTSVGYKDGVVFLVLVYNFAWHLGVKFRVCIISHLRTRAVSKNCNFHLPPQWRQSSNVNLTYILALAWLSTSAMTVTQFYFFSGTIKNVHIIGFFNWNYDNSWAYQWLIDITVEQSAKNLFSVLEAVWEAMLV